MRAISFKIEYEDTHSNARVGEISTPHGIIKTPAFVTVGTKGTIKALSPEQVKELGAQVVLANTYHLYLQPGEELIKNSGGLEKFMKWEGPTVTDSGGFQVFSLGAAYGKNITKLVKAGKELDEKQLEDPKSKASLSAKEKRDSRQNDEDIIPMAQIDADGVMFRSHIDGSAHFFTPEKSIEIQHNIGADIIFTFDECTSPLESLQYQKEALERTHRWAKRCFDFHQKSEYKNTQGLFGVVQGGQFKELREESARAISAIDFDGFGIGGSFSKEDMSEAVGWVNAILPKEKPRHLLGIGEPMDLFMGVENGCDTFDCVAPTRMARNGTLYSRDGRINIFNAQYRSDQTPIDTECACYTCKQYSRAYISHLFHADEMFAATLASIHNLYFIVHLVDDMRTALLTGDFHQMKKQFIERYYKNKKEV